MSLFSKSLYSSETVTENVTDNDVFETIIECNDEVNKIFSALRITDVMMEANLIPVTEKNIGEVIKGAVDKAIASIKKLWNKISDWFKTIFAKLKVLFTSKKNFLSKWGAKIKDKAKSMKNITVDKYLVFRSNFIDDCQKFANTVVIKSAEIVKNSGINALSKSDIREKFVEAIGKVAGYNNTSSISEIKELFMKDAIIEDNNRSLKSNDIEILIKYLESGESDTNTVKKLFNIGNQQFKTAISVIAALTNTTNAKEIEISTASFDNALVFIQSFSSMAVSFINTRTNYSFNFLKHFLTNKKFGDLNLIAKSESADEDSEIGDLKEEDPTEESTFVSIFNSL